MAIYLGWPLFTWLYWKAGLLFDFNQVGMQATGLLSLLLFILLACFLILLFFYHLQEWLAENLGFRLLFLVATMCMHTLLYHIEAKVGPCNVVVLSLLTANLLFFACLVATWMAMAVKRAAELVPLCAVMVLSDLFSIVAGPTKIFAEEIKTYYSCGMRGQTPIIDFFLVKIALPGQITLIPLFGISDWIIVTFLSATVVKFNFNDNLFRGHTGELYRHKRLKIYLPIAAAGLIFSVLMAQLAHIFLPALPIIVAFFLAFMLLKQPEIRQLQKKDWLLLAVFSTLMLGLLVAVGL